MANELLVAVDTEYESDVEELRSLTQSLQQQLLMTDVDDVRQLQGGPIPEGAKAAGLLDWGSLLVTLSSSGGVLVSLIGAMTSWLQRNQGTSLHLKAGDCEVDLKGSEVNPADVKQLIERCLAQERGRAGGAESVQTTTHTETPPSS